MLSAADAEELSDRTDQRGTSHLLSRIDSSVMLAMAGRTPKEAPTTSMPFRRRTFHYLTSERATSAIPFPQAES